MNKQKLQKTYEQISEWQKIGYKLIFHQKDGLDMKFILARQEEFVIIIANYATIEPYTITLDKKLVEKMYLFGAERSI